MAMHASPGLPQSPQSAVAPQPSGIIPHSAPPHVLLQPERSGAVARSGGLERSLLARKSGPLPSAAPASGAPASGSPPTRRPLHPANQSPIAAAVMRTMTGHH